MWGRGKEGLMKKITALCKSSLKPFGKSCHKMRTQDRSPANRGLFFFFFSSRPCKISVFIPLILYFNIFTDHLHCCIFLSQVSRRNQHSMFSNPKTYIACNHPQQPFLCLILSIEMKKAEKGFKFCSRTWTKLLWIPVLAYQDPLNKFCLLGFDPISVKISEHWVSTEECTHKTRKHFSCMSL